MTRRLTSTVPLVRHRRDLGEPTISVAGFYFPTQGLQVEVAGLEDTRPFSHRCINLSQSLSNGVAWDIWTEFDYYINTDEFGIFPEKSSGSSGMADRNLRDVRRVFFEGLVQNLQT